MFVWSELKEGLRFSSNMRFALFFFFWISAWISRFGGFGWFRPELARFSLNWPDSEPHRCESALKRKKTCGMTWWDAARRADSGVPRASPHPTALDAGAAPLVLCPCFTNNNTNFYSTFLNLNRYVDVNWKSGIVINKKDQQCTQAEHVLVSTKGNERT